MPHPFPNSVILVEAPYQGHGFMVAVSSVSRQIVEIKIGEKWWPVHDVASANLISELHRALAEMPDNTEGGEA